MREHRIEPAQVRRLRRSKSVFRRRTPALSVALIATVALALTACGDVGDSTDADIAASTGSDAPESDSAGSDATQPLTVLVGRGTIQGALLPRLGVEQGIFEENGLDVEFAEAKSSPEIAAALASGEIDIASIVPQVALPAIVKGADVRLLMDESDFDGQVVLGKDVPQSHLGKPYPEPLRDLVGKEVGVAAVGALQEFVIHELMQEAGIDGAEVDFVSVGFDGENPLAAGQIDALVTNWPDEILLGDGNYQVVVERETFRERFEDVLYIIYAMSGRVSDETAERFCRAMKDTWSFATDPANRDTVVTRIADDLNLESDDAGHAWDVIKSVFSVEAVSQESYNATAESPLLGSVEAPPFSEAVYQGNC